MFKYETIIDQSEEDWLAWPQCLSFAKRPCLMDA
jgi:hypothetical protein